MTVATKGRDLYSPLAFLDKRIERAKQGDKAAALSILTSLRLLLEEGHPIPGPLGAYLADCLASIERASDPAQEAGRGLNLTGRRGVREKTWKLVRDSMIVEDLATQLAVEMARPVDEALQGESSPLDRAIDAVATKYELSRRQIYRIVKPCLPENA
jgi:hypothetical protein